MANSFNDVTYDGRSRSYRDPGSFNSGGRSSRGEGFTENRHADEMLNPLYKYSEGAVRDAAGHLGIGNINSQKEVNKITSYLQQPRTVQAAAPKKQKKQQKTQDVSLAAPAEPQKTVLSREAAEANAFVDSHNSMTLGSNSSPLQGMAVSNQAGVSSKQAGEFKQNFQLKLRGSGDSPLTFTEASTGTKPTVQPGFMDSYKDNIKSFLEPR